MGTVGGNGIDASETAVPAAGGDGDDAANSDRAGDGGSGSFQRTVNANSGVAGESSGCAGGGGGGGVGTIQFFRSTCPISKCFPNAVSNP